MLYIVYILQSLSTNRHYIGHTNNLTRRLNEHRNGKTISTRNKGPWVLIHTETFPSKPEAYRREIQIKSYKGGEAFKKLVS